MKYFPFTLFTILVVGCNPHFKEKNTTIVWVDWNEAQGRYETELDSVDSESFQKIEYSFGKDLNRVFYKSTIVENADPKTFEVINDLYGKDKDSVYFKYKTVRGASQNSFQPLEEYQGYGRDIYDVFHQDSSIHACDPASFTYLEDNWFIDNKCVYHGAKRLKSANSKTFEVLSYFYGKDQFRVFYTNKVIDSADAVTFKVGHPCIVCAQDKNQCYENGKVIRCAE